MSVWRSVVHPLLTGPCGSGSDEHPSTALPRLVTGARGPEESDRLDRATQPLSTFRSRVGRYHARMKTPRITLRCYTEDLGFALPSLDQELRADHLIAKELKSRAPTAPAGLKRILSIPAPLVYRLQRGRLRGIPGRSRRMGGHLDLAGRRADVVRDRALRAAGRMIRAISDTSSR